ncbi:MAG TPA: tyrosine-type recombinase/integrase [Gemmataceae bacterium]|jgi:integrase
MSVRKRQAWGLPWFRNHDGWWYVTIKGRKCKLVKGEEEREAALTEWHRLMALAEIEDNKQANFVWVIFEKFLEYTKREHATSYHHYVRYLQGFKDRFPELRVKDLRVEQLREWFDANPGWGESTRSYATAILSAALNWAAKPEQNYLDRNPLRGVKRPRIRSRGAEAVIEEEDYRTIYEHASPWIQEALFFLRQTGTRPVNLARITAASIDLATRSVRLTIHKTAAKTGRALVIPLTQPALDLLVRLAERHPEGALFRSRRGAPMTRILLTKSFERLKAILKGKGKIKGNPILYGIRHTVATELLSKNVPDAKVAFILGHKGTEMIYRHYGHLDATSKTIAEELDRTLNGDAGTPAGPAA